VSAIRGLVVAAVLATAPALVAAQQESVEARLQARGVPADLAGDVAAIAADAAARGVPSGPLADKALEGWAKQVPATRIVTAVRAFADRLAQARDAVRAAGLAEPPGEVVVAAAEAMGTGLAAVHVARVVRASPDVAEAAPALSVTAALAAQGLGGEQAATIVVHALRGHRPMAQLLNLPSLARVMHSEGLGPGEIGRKMLEGGDDEGVGHSSPTRGVRPPGVPPGGDRERDTHRGPDN
jgi:hypothetical protein